MRMQLRVAIGPLKELVRSWHGLANLPPTVKKRAWANAALALQLRIGFTLV
jgi:hypothetical protein